MPVNINNPAFPSIERDSLNPFALFIWNAASGAYVRATTATFAGGGGSGSGGGDASAANQLLLLAQLNTGVVRTSSPKISGLNQQIFTTNGLVFGPNPNRTILNFQNLSTSGALLISYSGAASLNNFAVLLKADTQDYAGNGAIHSTDMITGAVFASGINFTRFVASQA